MAKQQQQKNLFETAPPPWEADEAAEGLVAQVVFAEGLPGPLDYLVPTALCGKVAVGCRVRVPLGRGNRPVTGYCVAVEHRAQFSRPLKPVKSLVDARPLLSPAMIELAHWMADYYLCTWGQAIEAVVPAGVRGAAGTREMMFLSVPTEVAARLAQLKLPPKQKAALLHLVAAPMPLTPPQLAAAVGCTQAPIAALRKKGLVHGEIRRVMQTEHDLAPAEDEPVWQLNDDQQRAYDVILDAVRGGHRAAIVVHGVTGSGKTEVYLRAIEEVISYGRQAIVLVPEISLTPQTRRRFQARFPHVAVLHSHLSDAERHWHWQRIADGQVQVVVGARSAVFAPTPQLGLIVLDEEHDASFKQDSVPRYHARDVALRRATMQQIPLVLGSATPSLESWQQAVEGSFQLVELPNRVSDLPLPAVGTIDLRSEVHSRHSRGALSRQMAQAVDRALRDGGQVILLLNRRGFSTQIQCPACAHVVSCPHCDIALTHHREGAKAICHYCDYQTDAPAACPECRFAGIRFAGFGTQRLEAEVRARFPGATCLRMDSDTMRKPGSHEQALTEFRDGKVQILLGTQMIAKGLDFPNVTLVGVVNADTALHLPDFRAAERTFQLVTQVAGRTGRGPAGGRVLVQTLSPDHAAIEAAVRHDFNEFARVELPSRREYGYPPYAGVVRLVVRGPEHDAAEETAALIARRITEQADRAGCAVRLLGPAPAPIARLRGKHRFHMLALAARDNGLREVIRQATTDLPIPDTVQWIVDVDPIDML